MISKMEGLPLKSTLALSFALALVSCGDGGGSSPDNDDTQVTFGDEEFDPGITVVVDGDEQGDVSQFGFINVLKNLPGSEQPIVTATFVGFDQEVVRPDREAEEQGFVEECILGPPLEEPTLSLTGEVIVNFGGNIAAGDQLLLNDVDSNLFATLEKVESEDGTGYLGRVPSLQVLPESLTVDIPGDVFPMANAVTIPRADPIEGFLPEPGTIVTRETSFTWTMMSGDEGTGTVFMDITIVNDNASLNCTVLDDGAFTVRDGLVLFGDETFNSGIFVSVARNTRFDTALEDAHIIATNSTVVTEEPPEEDVDEAFNADTLEPGEIAEPPELTEPTLYELSSTFPTTTLVDPIGAGCQGIVHSINLQPNEDAFISASTGSPPLQYPLYISGGRNVHVQGLVFRTVVQPGCDIGEVISPETLTANIHPQLPGGKVMYFQQSGTTFIEGVDIDLAGQQADCFVRRNSSTGGDSSVEIVNSQCIGNEGLVDGT